MFKNVLLDLGPNVDGNLISHVVDFCAKVGADLTILNVFEEPSPSVSSYFSSQSKDLRNIILEGHESRITEEAVTVREGVSVKTEIRWGMDFIETIRLVKEGGYDLLISASQEVTGPPDSTAMHLMRKCPCPVWIHRGELWGGEVRILAAVNTSDTTEENRALNRKIIEHSVHLTETLHGHLHVVTCWSGYMESVLASPRFSENEKADYLKFEQRQTRRELDDLFEAHELTDNVIREIRHGNPAEVIPRYAAEKDMDIVVMGSVARAGIPGLLVGNTAEKIVANLEHSILAIKPDGFDTPVK